MSSSLADESQLEDGVFLIPANATQLEPPLSGDGKIAVFSGDGWELVLPYKEPTPEQTPPPPPSRVPLYVTRFQALAALLQAGLLGDIAAYMSLETTDSFTRLAWQEVQVFKRDSPLVSAIGSLFGLTQVQIDDLFIFASTIEA